MPRGAELAGDPARVLEVEQRLQDALTEIDELRRRLGNMEAWAQSSHTVANRVRHDIENLRQVISLLRP